MQGPTLLLPPLVFPHLHSSGQCREMRAISGLQDIRQECGGPSIQEQALPNLPMWKKQTISDLAKQRQIKPTWLFIPAPKLAVSGEFFAPTTREFPGYASTTTSINMHGQA